MTGPELREIRHSLGVRRGKRLGAQEYAQLLDIPYSSYRRWESRPGPIPRHAAALVRAYLLLTDRQREGVSDADLR